MKVTLTISDELAAQAKARGVPVEVYVQSLIEQAAGKPQPQPRKHTPEEWAAWFEEFAQFSHKMPVLSDEAISRDAIYEDRGA